MLHRAVALNAPLIDATPDEFRVALVEWIDARGTELQPTYHDHGTTAQLLDHQRDLQRLLFDDGWMRWGWPTSVGGIGGSPLFRAILGEELTTRGLVHSAAWSMTEVLGPAVVHFAPALATEVVPPMLRGDERWCQGFSEPDAGSDLGSLRTTARHSGDDWIIDGQKLWTSWAHHAQRCIVLARTEDGVAGSRGITAFFVDMGSPGIDVRPLQTMADVDEFCEMFFDAVRVPDSRVIGKRGEGWAVAQHILACERGPIFWQRGGWLLRHLAEVAQLTEPGDARAEQLLANAYAQVIALRARSRATQRLVAAGHLRGADSSIDKVLIAAADQAVFDAARLVFAGEIELDDSDRADRFRKEWMYSRAATIYGGTSEIQRDIIANRLLDLPRGS
ncbi:MAG: acyl-CoA dehydrogenase [Actinomycetia bacterium]|nr:acyl-CoA dehydrogenase [Actinomycetes bacterium]